MRLWYLLYNSFLLDVENMGLVQALIPRIFMSVVVITIIVGIIQEFFKHG